MYENEIWKILNYLFQLIFLIIVSISQYQFFGYFNMKMEFLSVFMTVLKIGIIFLLMISNYYIQNEIAFALGFIFIFKFSFYSSLKFLEFSELIKESANFNNCHLGKKKKMLKMFLNQKLKRIIYFLICKIEKLQI